MGKQLTPLCWLVEEIDGNGETILSGRLGRGRLVGRLLPRDDGVKLWAIGLTEIDAGSKQRKQYAKRKKREDA